MYSSNDPIYIIFMRAVFAIVFILSGISGFTNLGVSEFFTPDATLVGSFTESPHYFILKGLEVVIGFLFVANFFVQTALVIATPLVLSVIGYHFWTDVQHGMISLLLLVPTMTLIYFYRDTFKAFFLPQIYTNHMGEDSAKVLVFSEVQEKAPSFISNFERIYLKVRER